MPRSCRKPFSAWIRSSHIMLSMSWVRIRDLNCFYRNVHLFNFRYSCTFVGDHQGYKMYSWNTTVSDHCCLGCDGTVYKADSVIEESSHEDACLSVETSICRRIPGSYKPPYFFYSNQPLLSFYIKVKKRPRLRWNTTTGTAAMTRPGCSLSRLSSTSQAPVPREHVTMTTCCPTQYGFLNRLQ